MKIETEIQLALAECHMLTGQKATRIYLGSNQMGRLITAQRVGGAREPYDNRITGSCRPEVMGCLVYEVNDADHCVAV